MKKEKDIRVEMTRVADNVAALVKVDYMDKDAQEHTGLLLLDSGSNLNFLTKEMETCMGELCKQKGESANILTVTGDKASTSVVTFSFVLGGIQFRENFCISDQLPQIGGAIPIIGLLGNRFLQQYRLAIDFSDFTLHTSHVSPDNLTISDCEFFFPMDIGLKYYGLPVLSMAQGDWEIVAMADTGATNNMISAPSLSDKGFQCEYLSSTDTIHGITGSVETKDAILSFDLQMLSDGNDAVIQRKDVFKVHPQYLIEPREGECDEHGEQLDPVEALIGCPFMAREGWILDFGANIIYKRKEKYVWDGNIRVDLKENATKPETGIIRFYKDATKIGLPYVLISEGDYAGIILLIDTGSTDNIMFGYTYNQIIDSLKGIEGSGYVYGIDGVRSEVHYAEWNLTFSSKQYEMRFMVKDEDAAFRQLSNEMGFPIAGIIGTRFLAEHGWMIDFCHQQIIIPKSDVNVGDSLKTEKENI